MIRFLPKKLLLTVFVGGWLVMSGLGIWRLAAYSLAPGAQGAAPTDWPADSAVVHRPGRFTIVTALHPECPCSQATVEELDSILAQEAGRLDVSLLFVELAGLPPVEKSKLWQRASRITGVRLVKDLDGKEARCFDTRTSGETRLYSPAGKLLFRGGITASRGHVGDNPGQAAVLTAIRLDVPSASVSTPVFGCALWSKPTLRSP
jgi:hypothetical protein